ncbi:MFS general substrate transporter [Marasmius fiardii PR-910]|nr:MFS general substrate transporter [Marasmius fiardii PR-910]
MDEKRLNTNRSSARSSGSHEKSSTLNDGGIGTNVIIQPVPVLKHEIEHDPEVTKPPNDIERQLRARSVWSSLGVIAATTLAMMANTANAASPAIALPTIQRELHVDQVSLVWIMSAYPLSGGCLLLMFGRLADLYGRKKMFIFGSVWLIAFTLGCGFANDAVTLSILRGIQGAGASATIPACLGILAETFPPSQWRSVAFASFAAGAPIGAAFGTAIGGVLTQVTQTTWRAVFWLSTGLSALALGLGMLAIEHDPPSDEEDRRTDWIGALFSTIALTLIVFVLGQGEEARPKQWGEGYIIALLIIGVFFLVMFLLWQRFLEQIHDGKRPQPKITWIPTPPPLMRLSLWTRANGRVAVVMGIQFLLSCAFLGWQYWTMLYYQNFLGLDAIHTVIRLIPSFVTGLLCNVIVALTVSRLPLVALMAVGTFSSALAALLFAIIQPEKSYWAYGFPAAIFAVIGADFVMSSGTLFIAKVSPAHEQSVAGAVFQCMQQLGTSIGVTVGTVVFNRLIQQRTGGDQGTAPREVLLDSYRAAQWTNFAFGILAALLALIFLQGVGIVGHRAPKHEHIRTLTKEEIDSLHLPCSSAHPFAGALGALIPANDLEHITDPTTVPRRRSTYARSATYSLSSSDGEGGGGECTGAKLGGLRGKAEALLTALEEEQRRSHKLREENADLKMRIGEFERVLWKFMDSSSQQQQQPLSSSDSTSTSAPVPAPVADDVREDIQAVLEKGSKRDTREFLRDENDELRERLERAEGALKRMDFMLDDGMDRLRVSRTESSRRKEVKWSSDPEEGVQAHSPPEVADTSFSS